MRGSAIWEEKANAAESQRMDLVGTKHGSFGNELVHSGFLKSLAWQSGMYFSSARVAVSREDQQDATSYRNDSFGHGEIAVRTKEWYVSP